MTRHAMYVVNLGGTPPSYRAQCTRCDVYSSKVWNPAGLDPLYHYGDGDEHPADETEGDDIMSDNRECAMCGKTIPPRQGLHIFGMSGPLIHLEPCSRAWRAFQRDYDKSARGRGRTYQEIRQWLAEYRESHEDTTP